MYNLIKTTLIISLVLGIAGMLYLNFKYVNRDRIDNYTILEWVEKGEKEEKIVSIIEKSYTDFSLDKEDIEILRQGNVSSKIIVKMKESERDNSSFWILNFLGLFMLSFMLSSILYHARNDKYSLFP
ncbi:hypothetical protein [Riemerella anatipestifer]|uniref:hypothetical protein n=1 Tax=Riemerella anatipestifer TaxID=34085 RepID=UPI0021F84DCD|nr:hypothetical protein [Riemerella anatipestifer]MCW0488313.1 hypothetical protein [Riemerella anatipestifer]